MNQLALINIGRSENGYLSADLDDPNKSAGKFSLLKLFSFLLIFCSLALPTGSLFGFPVKHFAYIGCFVSLLGFWASSKRQLPLALIATFLFVSVFVAFYLFLGAINPIVRFGYAFSEGAAVFSAITIVLLVLSSIYFKAISIYDVAAYVFYGALAFAIWKVLVVLALVAGVVTFPEVYSFLIKYIGYRPVTSGIFGGLVRFNLIIYDFVVAVLLYFVPAYPKIFSKVPKLLRYFFLVVGLACLVFAFSRLLFVLVAVLWGYLVLFKLPLLSRLVFISIAVVVVTMSAAWISGAFDQRFNDIRSSHSDDIRSEQVSALLNEWTNSPLIGGGFGSYAPGYVRDPAAPFSYEVQWVGFLAKLGVVGVSALIALVVALFYMVLSSSGGIDRFVISFVLAIFVLGSFTNQYLVSSASGAFYSLILALGFFVKEDGLRGA